MDFDQLLVRCFGTEDIASLLPEQLGQSVEHLHLQFGMERDSGRRFALWSLMYMLGDAPDLEPSFKSPEDRDAARQFMEMADREFGEPE